MRTYDPSTAAGKVRLLCGDTRVENDALFDDEEITAFLEIGRDNVYRAAALACEAIAVDSVRVLKVVQMLDLKTDGAAVARALRQQASEYRVQADVDESEIDILPMPSGVFAVRDYIEQLHDMEG